MLSHLNPIPSLPAYPGPFRVGTTDFEIPVSEITSQSAVPDPSITTVKFRVFYPTNDNATSSSPVHWLPSPQSRWTQAYASFMGASPRLSSIISYLPSILSYVKLPAVSNAPLRPRLDSRKYPVTIFSHGLGGNYNTYSSIVGGLASCGVVCIAPEHRDGSSPISFIKDSSGQVTKTVEYQTLAHSPSTEVLNARNAQLRTRLWELELIYTVVNGLDNGKKFSNYAEKPDDSTDKFTQKLNMTPGKVTWAGHSFGAATVTQFVKSVYYREHLPQVTPKGQTDGWDWTPLYNPVGECEVLQQITASSPVCLLDLWTMPLRGETAKWLWQRPLPCYERSNEPTESIRSPNVIAIMSAEFHGYSDLLNRTRALLSQSPEKAVEILQQEKSVVSTSTPVEQEKTSPVIEALAKRDPSPTQSAESSRSASPASHLHSSSSVASSQSSMPLSETTARGGEGSGSNKPLLYVIPQSAHLSQSDFGPLFPRLARYAMKAIEPEKTIELNIRAMVAVMKGCDLAVENIPRGDDQILSEKGIGQGQRWQKVPLLD